MGGDSNKTEEFGRYERLDSDAVSDPVDGDAAGGCGRADAEDMVGEIGEPIGADTSRDVRKVGRGRAAELQPGLRAG